VLLGVKQACNKTFREQMPVEFVAAAQQHAERDLRFGENAAYSNENLRECDGLPKNFRNFGRICRISLYKGDAGD
jgi:hypothetical protein